MWLCNHEYINTQESKHTHIQAYACGDAPENLTSCANVLLNIATSHTETYMITVRVTLYKQMHSQKHCRSKERGRRRGRDIEPPDVASL